jgi:glycine hydroxymethyltransferase
VTTRGFGKEEIKQIAAMIIKILSDIDNPKIQKEVKEEVSQMCSRFPVPGIDD